MFCALLRYGEKKKERCNARCLLKYISYYVHKYELQQPRLYELIKNMTHTN